MGIRRGSFSVRWRSDSRLAISDRETRVIATGSARAEQEMIHQSLENGVKCTRRAMWSYSSVSLVLGRSQKPSAAMLERAARRASTSSYARRRRRGHRRALDVQPHRAAAARPRVRPDEPAAQLRCDRRGVASALGRLGIPTAIAPRVTAGPAGVDDAMRWVCFASLSYGELVGPDNRKIVGLAQVRRRNGVAICAGLLLNQPDWPRSVACLARAG